MSKFLLIDLCNFDVKEGLCLLGKEGIEESLQTLEKVFNSSLDILDFTFDDVVRNIVIIGDGGDYILLKDGRVFNVCWRCGCCRVWLEEDVVFIKYLNKLIKEFFNGYISNKQIKQMLKKKLKNHKDWLEFLTTLIDKSGCDYQFKSFEQFIEKAFKVRSVLK